MWTRTPRLVSSAVLFNQSTSRPYLAISLKTFNQETGFRHVAYEVLGCSSSSMLYCTSTAISLKIIPAVIGP